MERAVVFVIMLASASPALALYNDCGCTIPPERCKLSSHLF